MKKTGIMALALAAAAPGVHAQSSVTLYGVVDGSILWQTTAAASFSPKARNTGSIVRYKDGGVYTSLWGMKGEENLGGGYRATFQLQGNFDSGSGKFGPADTPGTTAIFNQVATVGVSGGFGSVKAGRQYAPMILALAATDVRHAQYFGSILTALVGINSAAGWVGASTNGPLGAIYDSNAIVYTSPTLAGVTLNLEYAPGGVAGQWQGGTRESAVLQYDNYGLKLAAIYYNGHDTNPPAGAPLTGVDNNRLWSLSALYTRNDFSVGASYMNGRDPSRSNIADYDIFSGGVGYRFTPAFNTSAAVYYLRDKNNSANHSIEYVLGAEYSLSKATMVYADAGYVDNHGAMNQTLAYGQPVAPGRSTTGVIAGLRHKF